MTATTLLPPTPRDFEIHRLNRIEHASTYSLAERYKISQTRVRQIVYRVGQWLASVLPARSDIEKEQEARLAQCLAADQLQTQAEKLQVFWEETHDVRYLRQQSRVIVALARLGVVPGAIDSAAAEALEDDDRGAGVSPERREESKATNGSTAEITGRPEASPTIPPVGDCSPVADFMPAPAEASSGEHSVTAAAAEDCADDQAGLHEDLAAMNLLERRLLSVIDGLPPNNAERRQDLETNLTNIRRERATIELRLSPEKPRAEFVEFAGEPSSTEAVSCHEKRS
jgi:hypothetical protein